jgi:hypothetical protein
LEGGTDVNKGTKYERGSSFTDDEPTSSLRVSIGLLLVTPKDVERTKWNQPTDL